MIVEILDADIERAEKLVLRPGLSFDRERRDFIRSLASVDVQACPGSGKTTALLAKLLIFSSKPTAEDNSGICVLTHTNVAVEAIKGRFGIEAGKMLRHPNYVGTIQGFVDRFLAIPAFVSMYGRRPVAIDNEQFTREVGRKQGVDLFRAKYFLEHHDIRLEDLRFSFSNFRIAKSLNETETFVGVGTPTYKAIEEHKLRVLGSGYLCFDDAYSVANLYLKKHPEWGDLLTRRFRYVFIDEMQDTDVHQNYVLDALFSPERVVIQRVGDRNQAIYTYDVNADLVWAQRNVVYINGSRRLSQATAKAISNVSLEPQELLGNSDVPEIRPKLLVFEDGAIGRVIERFRELIVENGLGVIPGSVFKAVVWVGKHHEEKHTIPDYDPTFVGKRGFVKALPTCLYDFLSSEEREQVTPARLRNSVLDAASLFLTSHDVRHANGRRFTPRSLRDFIEERSPSLFVDLDMGVLKWVREIRRGGDVFLQVKEFVRKVAGDDGCGFRLGDLASDPFFERPAERVAGKQESSERRDVSSGPTVEVDTVHGVKGETHTATLYLETFHYGYDVNMVLRYLNPTTRRTNLSVTQKRALKVAYVGMSRPTHMLCVAVHMDTVGYKGKRIMHDPEELRRELGEYWDVVEVRS